MVYDKFQEYQKEIKLIQDFKQLLIQKHRLRTDPQ
jgi:hypothetical protein